MTTLKNLILGLVVAFGLLAVVEAGLRIIHTVYLDVHDMRHGVTADDRAWSVFSRDLGWTLRPGYQGVVGQYPRAFDAQGLLAVDSRQAREPGHKVLFIGDSNTFGVGTPTDHSFAEVTERLMPGVSAINLGVPGYTSFQGRRVLEKYLPTLKPEAVVVSFNFNDKKGAMDYLGPDSDETMEKVYRSSNGLVQGIRRFTQYSSLAHVLRIGLERVRLLPAPAQTVRIDSMPTRVEPSHYRENLAAMAETAKRAGVPIVFLVLRDNPLYTHATVEGAALVDSARYDEGIKRLQFAVHADNPFSELARLHLGRAFRAMGRDAAADSVLESPSVVTKVFGGRPIHFDSVYNDAMREVAAQYGVPVVDAGPILFAHPYDFTDYCHFNAAAHERIGAQIAMTLRGQLRGVNGPPLAVH